MTFLLYMELFLQACLSALLFVGLNALGSLATVHLHLAAWTGPSYLLSAVVGSVVAYSFLAVGVRRLDRVILSRYSPQ